MSTERRTFRPFDVPASVVALLSEARIRIGESDEFVEAGTRRVIDVSELRAGRFALEASSDENSFAESLDAAIEATAWYGEGSIDLLVVIGSSYLKIADVVFRIALDQVEWSTQLSANRAARAFDAIHHGCDIDAFLVLNEGRVNKPLEAWRKNTWLARAHFELRTGLDGLGFTILPLTDEKRAELELPLKSLRYTVLDESPLETSLLTTITLYVDHDLLALLNKTPRKNWAKAFTDQLAVDVLTAIAMRAVADPAIQDASWGSIETTLLGALVLMVGGRPKNAEQHYQNLLELLRSNPLRFLALIEGATDMRETARLIPGGA